MALLIFLTIPSLLIPPDSHAASASIDSLQEVKVKTAPFRPMVRTSYGDLEGIRKNTLSGDFVDQFLGIPYASPPVGELRFSKSKPPKTWTGIRDASVFANECLQRIMPGFPMPRVSDKPLAMSEDCLYLNIYRPVTDHSDLLPVMVWVHGGCFAFGAGSQYEGSELAAHGVIVVTINYRLGVLGFLSNEDDVIPGNYGMLDQIQALKWVKGNIRSFGGDPDLITVFGLSSGAATVSVLVLSPLASGLFQRAIIQSGPSVAPWATDKPSKRLSPRQMVMIIGTAVGCHDSRDALSQLHCLRNVEAGTLFNTTLEIEDALGNGMLLTPVVETKFGLLPDYPINMWSRNEFNHVDTIRGFTKGENGILMLKFLTHSLTVDDFKQALKSSFLRYTIPDMKKLVTEITEEYVENDIITTKEYGMRLQLIKALSDIMIKGPSVAEAKIESKMAPEKKQYIYQLDHKSGLSLYPQWMPLTHDEDAPFVFGVDLKEFQVNGKSPTPADRIVSNQIQTFWTNFAKYGDPTRTVPSGGVKWNTYNSENEMVLRINVSSHEVSFKNDSACNTFLKVMKTMDNAIHDPLYVG